MRIAFTGTSSTGKTTLARELMRVPEFANVVGTFLTEDARALLRELAHKSMDTMSRDELRRFQEEYFQRKAKKEQGAGSFLVDRSFVDVAAYWLVRDTVDLPPNVQEKL